MDFCAVRTLKLPGSVICSTRCWLGATESIAVSYGKRIEFYSHNGFLLKTVLCNSFVTQMAQLFESGDSSLFLLSGNNEYVVLKDGESREAGHLFQRHVDGIRPLKVLGLKGFITILLSNSRVVFVFQRNGNLVFYDKFNYFGSYKILDLAACGERFFFLMENIDNKVVYMYYGLKPSGDDFTHFQTGSFSPHTYKVAFYKDKLVLFQKGKIALFSSNKVIYQTNFANPGLKSWIETGDGLLLSMKNGELIRLKVNEHIDICEIHDLEFCMDNLLCVNGVYFGGSYLDGKIFFELEDRKLSVLQRDRGLAHPRYLKFSKGLELFSNKSLCRMKYLLSPDIVKEVEFESPIKKTWIFSNSLFVSFPGRSIIYDLVKGKCIKEFDEIRNTYNHRGFKFNTENLLVETQDGVAFSIVEWENIILSAYHEEYILLYSCRKLQLLKNRALLREKEHETDVYMLFLDDFILLSTANSECVFYDYRLEAKKRVFSFPFIACTIFDEKLFLLDKAGAAYISEMKLLRKFLAKNVKEELFKKILPPDYHRYALFPCKEKGYLLITGVRPCAFFAGNSAVPFEISVSDISSFAFYCNKPHGDSDLLLMARKNTVLFSKPEIRPEVSIEKVAVREDVKFAINLGKTNKKVVGVVKKSKELVSNLMYFEEDTLLEEYMLKDKMAVFAEYFKGGFIVVGLNFKDSELSSELSLFDVRKGIKHLHAVSSPGLLHSISLYKNRFVTSHGSKMAIYKVLKGKIAKKAETSALLFPVSFRFGALGRDIFVGDMIKSLRIFVYNKKEMSLVEKNRGSENGLCRVLELLDGTVFAADASGHFYVYPTNSEEYRPTACFYYGEGVLDTCVGYLNPAKNKVVYFATENGSVGLLTAKCKFNREEWMLAEILQKHIKERRIFKYDATERFFDIDLFQDIKPEDVSRETGSAVDKVKALLNKVQSIF